PRKARQRALARAVEQPLAPQALLELLERELQGAEPARLEQLDHQLVLAALRIELDGAEGEHVQAVGRLEADAPHAIAKAHRAPPGTGVTPAARGATESKSTSPASLPVSRRLTPTSITQAPSFTMSPVIMRGRPAATQSTSARRVCSARSRVRVWHMVTVAWR